MSSAIDVPRRALIIGNPSSVFPRELATIWRSRGLEVGIVTRHWSGGDRLDDGTPVFVAAALESSAQRRVLAVLERRLEHLEGVLISRQRQRYERALELGRAYEPRITPAIVNGISIARLVRRLRPDFVLGQEAFSFGLATAWCRGIPRVLMPWGGDIFMFCDTTTAASIAVTHALRGVDLIVTGAVSSVPYIQSRFRVAADRVHYGGCWRLDRATFRRAEPVERARVLERLGIPPDRLLVVNIRRYFPGWGSEIALDAFIRFARITPEAFFILVGGAGTEPYTEQARRRLAEEGLLDRFLVLEGDRPLVEFAELMSVSDIAVSLILKRDMRSGSVLQAIAAGCAPVVSDQAEYRAMEADGFRAAFVSATDPAAVVTALSEYRHATARDAAVTANHSYLARHEDGDREIDQLLARIDGICRQYDHRRGAQLLSKTDNQPGPWIDELTRMARQTHD